MKSTDNNDAAKLWQTADKEKKRGAFMVTEGVMPRPLVQQNIALSLQVIARGFARLLSFFPPYSCRQNFCALPYLECFSPSFKIVALLNKYPGLVFP